MIPNGSLRFLKQPELALFKKSKDRRRLLLSSTHLSIFSSNNLFVPIEHPKVWIPNWWCYYSSCAPYHPKRWQTSKVYPHNHFDHLSTFILWPLTCSISQLSCTKGCHTSHGSYNASMGFQFCQNHSYVFHIEWFGLRWGSLYSFSFVM